jgi:hypothetical protein
MVGLRGVGKTVLLDRIRDDAEGAGIHTIRIEAPEGRSLPALLAPQLRQALLRLSRNEKAKDLAQRGLRALAGFAKALKMKYQDIEVGFDFDPEPGLADNADLEHDLQDLLEAAGAAAQEAGTALVLFIDELQYVQEKELAALIMALHRTAQRRLPVVLVGAGLPSSGDGWAKPNPMPNGFSNFPRLGLSLRPQRKLRSPNLLPLKGLKWTTSNYSFSLLTQRRKDAKTQGLGARKGGIQPSLKGECR